jgi:hypothetical protein
VSASIRLIEEITHCPEVEAVWAGDELHPCRRVVTTQPADPGRFQVPEPWAGHLHEAPILMISSNPSISEAEPYPTWDAATADRVGFFDDRFGDGPTQVRDGVRHPLIEQRADGSWHSKNKVAFWRDCKANVEYLLQRPADPGVDYVMTEVVHCKSRREEGVDSALSLCVDRWLERVLAVSPAPAVVVLGQKAEEAIAAHLGVQLPLWQVVEATLGGRRRLVLNVRHPNYFGRRKWQDHLSSEVLERLRAAVAYSRAIPATSEPGPQGDHVKQGGLIPEVAVSAPVAPAATAVFDRFLDMVGDHVRWDVVPAGPTLLVSRQTERLFATVSNSILTLVLPAAEAELCRLPVIRYGRRSSDASALHEVAIDVEAVGGIGDQNRLLVLLLRALYADAPGDEGPLTVHDLIDAFAEQARFLHGPDDMFTYWSRRVDALCRLLGLMDKVIPPEDGRPKFGFRQAHQFIVDVQGSLSRSSSPFAGVLEIYPTLIPILDRHAGAFGDLEERRLSRGRAVTFDILALLDPDIDSRLTHTKDLQSLGVSPHPPRDQLALDISEWGG